jgi:hypothetical protein
VYISINTAIKIFLLIGFSGADSGKCSELMYRNQAMEYISSQKVVLNLLQLESSVESKNRHNDRTILDSLRVQSQKAVVGFGMMNKNFHGHVQGGLINDEKRLDWIVASEAKLEHCINNKNLQVIESREIVLEDYYQHSYRLIEEGYVEFSDGSCLCMITNSSHRDPYVGDLTLAMDREGRMYINQGHICGEIIHFIIEEKLEIKSSEEFLRYFVSDTDDSGWLRYEMEVYKIEKE